MTRRRLLTSLTFMLVLTALSVVVPLATNTRPTLGLDLQGGFSVVLQAKEVNGQLPSEEAVEKAKDIIRQRVDGLGVAEPDITRQGRTVVVQLPGVRNRKKAESVIGCTARLEFRPVLADLPNPAAVKGTTTTSGAGSTTTTAAITSTTTPGGPATTADPAGTTTAPAGDPATTTTVAGNGSGDSDETGMGSVGIAPGEGALPAQFAPTTTMPPTTAPPVTEAPPVTAAPPTTMGSTTTSTTVPEGSDIGGARSCGGGTATKIDPNAFNGAPGTIVPSKDGTRLFLLGPVGFSGDALSKAQATISSGSWLVDAAIKSSFKAQANRAFAACNAGGPDCPANPSTGEPGRIAIILDGQVLSDPAVQEPNLADKGFTISGNFSEGEAKDLALVLRYGSLPVVFQQAALEQVSATLGSDSLRAGLIAGVIGIAALALYMILYYRGFGMVVVTSLFVWMGLMWGLVCLLSEQQGLALTLAGITGIIVSVGTTVDTYVVVFERVKDEIREGRSVRVATERGYESGIRTVFTANGAAFIGAFLLWWLTVGPVRGFAYFLGLSVILDLAVAVLFTRPLILLLARSPRFAKARFFGVGTATDQVTLPAAASKRGK